MGWERAGLECEVPDNVQEGRVPVAIDALEVTVQETLGEGMGHAHPPTSTYE